jgi:hypothetical protein
LLFSALVLSAAKVFASEAPAEGAAAKTEAKQPEWIEIQSRIQTLKAKVTAKEKAVRELILEKQKEKNPSKSVEIFKNLKSEHRELGKAVQEYEQARNLLRYRYPEKGMKEGRTYQRVEVKPLDEMENQMGMEGKLRQTLNRVRRQYSDTHVPEPSAEEAAAAVHKEELRKQAPPPVTEPSVISK